ncbi:MAG: hypothetical protein II697_04065 [Clostridia bacterium]|nr:hypothetical protein [Clostridia bacterium]
MNYYGTFEHLLSVVDYDKRVFSHCDFSKPSDDYSPGREYLIRCYSAEDNDALTRSPFRDLNTGLVCRLLYNNKERFEWRYVGASPRKASIIHHANGNTYLLYYEELYGYSVRDLKSKQSIHYIPQESHERDRSRFSETLIWCTPHYDPGSSLLAVEGCLWGAPYTVFVVDFSDPMRIVESRQWLDLNGDIDQEHYDEMNFVEWNEDSLVCDTGVFSKSKLLQDIRRMI